MICDALNYISRRIAIQEHTYIGFGSVYFVDFNLFHRTFGFKDMISIEGDRDSEKRVKFNAPFSCIEVKMGYSGAVLPTLGLTGKKSIVWLDYDYGLNTSVLTDVKLVCQAVAPGSILILTLDYSLKEFSREPEDGNKSQEMEYDELVEAKPWVDLSSEEMFEKKAGFKPLCPLQGALDEAYRLALDDAVKTASGTNRMLSRQSILQFLNFHYNDAREMMTVAFFLGDEQEANPDKINFNDLLYYRDGKDFFEIDPPKLTFKEIRSLNEHMPCDEDKISKIIEDVPLSEEYVKAYRSFYKYFPTFTEVEF